MILHKEAEIKIESTEVSFYRKRTLKICQRITVQSRFYRFFAEGGRSKNKKQWNNKLKQQNVLSTKTPNKICF